MKIPNRVKIGGHWVKVKKEDDIPAMGGNMGDSWNAHNSIRICTIYPESQQAATFLHEILHHIFNNLGLEYKKDDACAIHSERNTEAIAEALFQALRDNKLDFSN